MHQNLTLFRMCYCFQRYKLQSDCCWCALILLNHAMCEWVDSHLYSFHLFPFLLSHIFSSFPLISPADACRDVAPPHCSRTLADIDLYLFLASVCLVNLPTHSRTCHKVRGCLLLGAFILLKVWSTVSVIFNTSLELFVNGVRYYTIL